jgi:hypothetical protein
MPKQVRTRRMLAHWERAFLSTGLAIVAFMADWLLARRLAHDRARAGRSSSTQD